jgi:hypothetical protein
MRPGPFQSFLIQIPYGTNASIAICWYRFARCSSGVSTWGERIVAAEEQTFLSQA